MRGVVLTESCPGKCDMLVMTDALGRSESLGRTYSKTLQDALQQHHYNFVLCDPYLPDHPIVYASEGFLEMTGYNREEVLGRNCRFLQGPNTDKRSILEIRESIREERSCQVKILNYTKAGKPFWNLFHLAPVYSQTDGRVVHFVGVQTPISKKLAAALDEELKKSATKESSTPRDSAQEGEREEEEDDDEGDVRDEDKKRAATAVDSVLSELTESSNKGVGARRSQSLTFPGVICSSLALSLTRIQQSFVLVDPQLPNMPIVHASDVFLRLTGYSREEVVGRNCRFLQGIGTDPQAVEQIRMSIKNEKACTVRILNYRKNKEAFWNLLHIAPVRNANGKVAFYSGIQVDVTGNDGVTGSDDDGEEEYNDEYDGESVRMKHLGALGAIRVAVRSLQGHGLRRVKTFS